METWQSPILNDEGISHHTYSVVTTKLPRLEDVMVRGNNVVSSGRCGGTAGGGKLVSGTNRLVSSTKALSGAVGDESSKKGASGVITPSFCFPFTFVRCDSEVGEIDVEVDKDGEVAK